MKFFNLLVLSGLSATLLISCDTKRSPYVGDGDSAQFFIGDVDGKTETVHRNSDKKPDQTKIKFTACLKAIGGSSLPNGLLFDVQAGSEAQSAKTNIDGCITWTEQHKFNPTAYERNLRLARTIVSKNEYTGKRSVNIYWNPKSNALENNLKDDKIPVRTEDPVEKSFKMADATTTVQSTTPGHRIEGGDTISSEVPGQQVDIENVDPTELETRLVLSSISLTHVKLNQETPYRVDNNLTLFTQHTYQVSADPKYYVNTIDNPDEEVSPPGGKFKITLVFMDDPHVDLEKLSSEIGQHQTIESIKKATTPEGRQLKLATEVMISDKELSAQAPLTAVTKRQILTKALLSHVHATAQFVADKKAEQNIEKYVDIEIKKLAALDVRSIVAVTIENVSADQRQKLKGHGVGYVNNLLSPGSVTLLHTPIEADDLYAQYTISQANQNKIKPLDLFMKASNDQLKDRALGSLNLSSIPRTELNPSMFRADYAFNQEFEAYLANQGDYAAKARFNAALCYKLFMLEELKPLDAESGWFNQTSRKNWVQRCQAELPYGMPYFQVQVIDFVESTADAKVTKMGQSVREDIKISRSFQKSDSNSSSYGRRFEASISSQGLGGMVGSFLVDGVIAAVTVANPVVGVALGIGVKFAQEHFPISSGGSLYYSSAVETSTVRSEGISRETSQAISVNIDSYKINVETRRCAQITYSPWVEKYLTVNKKLKLRKGFIACAAKSSKPSYYEKYYMVTQACSESNGTTDCASSDENVLRMVLRGEAKYKQFNDMVTNTKLSIFLDPIDSEVLEKARMKWSQENEAAKTSQVFPGAFVPVMK